MPSPSIRSIKIIFIVFSLLLVRFIALSQSIPETAATISRGAYLQDMTSSSIIIRWKTAEKSIGKVWLGRAPTDLKQMIEEKKGTTDHALSVTGLTPETTYYYAIGAAGGILEGKDPSHFFVTAPPAGRSTPTRIWVVGDSGTGDPRAKSVRDAYLSYAGSHRADLWLMLGDNAYPRGADESYQSALFDIYPTLLPNTTLWPTIGNHDTSGGFFSSKKSAYFDIFTLPQSGEAGGVASGTEAYYSFDYGNIHFVSLDSNQNDRSVRGPMLTWLKKDLAANRSEWLIAYWHHPPYSKGSHNSDVEDQLIDMRKNALPILEERGVDLVLSGHSHSYERSFLINGHYGPSSTFTKEMILNSGDGRADGTGPYVKPGKREGHQGTVYVVAGSAGHTGRGDLNYPAMFTSLGVLGSLVLDIDHHRLNGTFIDNSGKIEDHFTIEKK
ncbi:MAG: metallophosphoesterase family protein [Nitrospirae bacterium]|nr:metallophosphoesterase family protein [Candidatus Manganitrophaceae bacterium]